MSGETGGCEARDGGQDLIGRFGPPKGLWLLIIDGDELADSAFQLGNTAMRATLDLPLGEQGEPALDLIEPGGMRGSEAQIIPRSFL